MTRTAEQAFAAALEPREGGISLARAAIAIGLVTEPQLDVNEVAGRLEALADEVRSESGSGLPLSVSIERLNEALFVRRGFSGNRREYDDPRNCYVHEVLSRRTGIPITLSLIYVEVGRRLGLQLDGISFPAHFIVRAGPDLNGTLHYLDPFNQGAELSRAELSAFLRHQGGNPERQLDTLLTAATPRQVLARMLNNLERVHGLRHEWETVRTVLDLQLVLAPWSLETVRDRGLVSLRAGKLQSAADDLATYLAHSPDAADRPRIESLLAAVQRRLS